MDASPMSYSMLPSNFGIRKLVLGAIVLCSTPILLVSPLYAQPEGSTKIEVGRPEPTGTGAPIKQFAAPSAGQVVLTSRGLFLNQDLCSSKQLYPNADWWVGSLIESLELKPSHLSALQSKSILDLAGGGSFFAEEAVTVFGASKVTVVDLNQDQYDSLLKGIYPDPKVNTTKKMTNREAAISIYQENMGRLAGLIDGKEAPWAPAADWKTLHQLVNAQSKAIGTAYFGKNAKIVRRKGDATKLSDLKENEFDLSLNSWMMMYLNEDARKASLRELVRVTKRGGQIRIQGGNEEAVGGVVTGYAGEKYGLNSTLTPAVSAARFDLWFQKDRTAQFANPESPDFQVHNISLGPKSTKRVRVNWSESRDALLVIDVLPDSPAAAVAAVAKPFNWTQPLANYKWKQILASANKPIFLWDSTGTGVLIKLFSCDPNYSSYASPSRAGLFFEQSLLTSMGVPNDGPAEVYKSGQPGVVTPESEVGQVKNKLKTIIGQQLPQRFEPADEVWVLGLVTPWKSEFGYDTIGGFLTNFPVRADTVATPVGSIELLNPNLKINDQLATLNEFITYIQDPTESRKLAAVTVIDAVAGNDDRLLKSGEFLKWDNILLGVKGSPSKMATVAIDNGSVAAYVSTRGKELEISPDRAVYAAERDLWVNATINGYLDTMQAMSSANLELVADPDRAAKRITLNLRQRLVESFTRLNGLHPNLISEKRSEYRADSDLWSLRPAVEVRLIKKGTKDKNGQAAPQDAGEFKYGSESKVDWLKIDKEIADGIREAISRIAAESGGDRMLEPGVFASSRIGKLAAAAKLKTNESSDSPRSAWDTVAARQLLLRIYYLDLRINKKIPEADARQRLAVAVDQTARM
jgi:hypothetical protein